MKLLQDLYFIYSPSRKEEKMSKFVQGKLKEFGVQDFKVLGNQIYRINKDTPMIVAHMDQVTLKPITKLHYNTKENTIFGDGNIGADDKNGIWILLNLLKTFKEVSFIFSDCEESSGNINAVFEKVKLEDKDILNTIKYCIVFDRRNGTDIIGCLNNYCNKDLENDIANIGKQYGYKSSRGLWGDCDLIGKYLIPCVNLSCGYYLAHTEKEYTSVPELQNALAFGKEILESLTESYSRVTKKISYIRNFGKAFLDKINWNTDRWWDRYDEKEYHRSGELFYCTHCGEHFSEDEIIIVDECPQCKMPTIETVGHHTSFYDSNDGNIIEYYYCSHCDTYTDIDDSIIGLEDSPEMCRQCGNIKYHFREFKDEDNLDESCINCPDYPSLLCDDSSCKKCPFFNLQIHNR